MAQHAVCDFGLLLLLVLCLTSCPSAATSSPTYDETVIGDCPRDDPLYAQVQRDLELWAPGGILASSAPDFRRFCPSLNACSYATLLIENGTVYLTGQVDRSFHNRYHAMMLGNFLLEVYEASLHVHLPDAEFAIYGGDNCPWENPQLIKEATGTSLTLPHAHLPILLTFSKTLGEACVLMPFSAHQRCSRDNIDHLMMVPDALPATPWADRKAAGFGRWTMFCAWWQGYQKWPNGTTMGCARQLLPDVGRLHPDLLDVGTTKEGRRPFGDHSKYKYAVSTDGWTASSRLEKVMLTGAAVLKQTSPRIAYFYSLLREYEHFIPYWKTNTSDIVQAIEWARAHDEQARTIAATAGAFVRKNMHRKARLCYWRHLMAGIGRLMRYRPVPCSQRDVCVPLLQELSLMGQHIHCSPDNDAVPAIGTVHQQLNAMHGRVLDHGPRVGKDWGTTTGRVARAGANRTHLGELDAWVDK